MADFLKTPKGLKDTRSFLKKPFRDKQHLTYCTESLKNMPKNSFFIDSCIFLGILRKDENTRTCKSFISRINNGIYTGYISPFVTGEMINSILYADNINKEIKPEILHAIVDILVSAKVKNFVPLNKNMMVYSELREADNRISESDLMHVICAKILDIPLITTDNKLLKSRGLKKHVDILSPDDVLSKFC